MAQPGMSHLAPRVILAQLLRHCGVAIAFELENNSHLRSSVLVFLLEPWRQGVLEERPNASTSSLFLCLKGGKRGQVMTSSGLRSLFRYHRRTAGVAKANPHRFRHTFGADMARGGISLAALMKLMGHSDIHTTMLYVELSPKDVFEEFHRVVARISRETPLLKET